MTEGSDDSLFVNIVIEAGVVSYIEYAVLFLLCINMLSFFQDMVMEDGKQLLTTRT